MSFYVILLHCCSSYLLAKLSYIFSRRLILRKRTAKSWNKSNGNACNRKWGRWILIIRFLPSLPFS